MCILLLGHATAAHADPMLTSWFTANSGKYARIYTTTANRASGISATTWGSSSSGQYPYPTYAGVHEIDYSANWVYIKNTGLSSFIMGPWNNPNLPKNQGTSTSVYRFPRGNAGVSTTPATKTLTGMGAIGFLVDGVAIYNTSDGFSYSNAHAQDADPIAGIGNGDGIWNRDAWVNEYGSFDYAYNHPQPSGQYHSHANPIATRYLLGRQCELQQLHQGVFGEHQHRDLHALAHHRMGERRPSALRSLRLRWREHGRDRWRKYQRRVGRLGDRFQRWNIIPVNSPGRPSAAAAGAGPRRRRW